MTEATPAQVGWASACPTSPGPSKLSDRISSGIGGTMKVQVMKPTMSFAPARLMTRLPAPQAAAASTTSARPPRLIAPPSAWIATSPMPTKASAMPTTCIRRGRSRSRTAAKNSVNNAWAWSTSEARPAGTPTSMPMNSSENLTTPMITPTATIQRQGTERGRASTTRTSAASA